MLRLILTGLAAVFVLAGIRIGRGERFCEGFMRLSTRASRQPSSENHFYKQTKNMNETGSNLSLGTRLTVLSKRLGRKRCCDATPDRCLGGVPSHYLRFAL